MTGQHDPRVVVVTGASSGIGRAITRAFGARGCKVALIARNERALDMAAVEVRQAGGEALVLPLDIADAEACRRGGDCRRNAMGSYRRLDQLRDGHRVRTRSGDHSG